MLEFFLLGRMKIAPFRELENIPTTWKKWFFSWFSI
jgi:hypothetical protein